MSDIYIYILYIIYYIIYILVLTCSLNEQKYGGTFHFEFGHEVHLTGMYVNCALSVI